MNNIKSFTFYNEYYELIDNLPTNEEKKEILLAVLDYVFNDIEPNLDGMNKAIFNNLRRPIDISKNQSKRRVKKTGEEPEENQRKTGSKTGEKPQQNTSMMSMSNVNVKDNKRDNRGMGEEEKKEEKGIDDVSLLKELPKEDTDDTSKLGEMSKAIIDYLNEKVGTRYRSASKNTRSHINARLKEGYTLDDFKTVIDKKTKEWLNDRKMSKYLRPETLFGSKFEGYLNEVVVVNNEKTSKQKSYQKYSQRDYTNDEIDNFYDSDFM